MTNILVVDDNSESRYMLDTLLQSNGFAVTLAGNGREALELAGDNPPNLVISDILMPVMDGFSFCRRWMQDPRLRTIPFIFYSATYTETQDIEFGLGLGARRYIVKPTEPYDFLRTILDVLEEFEKDALPSAMVDIEEEPTYLKVYNERLVKQLELKMQQADAAKRRLLALFQVSTTLSLLQPESVLIEQALTVIAESMGYTRAHYWTFDTTRQELTYLLTIGEASEQSMATRQDMSFPLGQEAGLVGLVAAEAVPLIVEDVDADWRWIKGDPSIRSALLLPIIHDDKLYGVCTFVSRDTNAFSLEDFQNATVVSNTLAIAVENVRLYQRQLETMNQLEELVAARTAELSLALEQAQAADRLKSQFVSDINHELRTPLTTINFSVDLLPFVDDQKRDATIQRIKREVVLLSEMIEDLLDLSRFDLGATPVIRLPVQLGEIVERVLSERSELAHRKGFTVDYIPSPALPSVLADQNLMLQMFTSLFTNAINYMHDGKITVRTDAVTEEDRQWCTVAIADTGPGIAPDEMEHLFERFYRGAAARVNGVPGTGLGLAICKEILDRHGGHLTVESELGQGSTFTVWMPAIQVDEKEDRPA